MQTMKTMQTMKSLILAAAVAAFAPAASSHAYNACPPVVAPQAVKTTILAKNHIAPKVSSTSGATSVKPHLGRRPVVNQPNFASTTTTITVGATVTAPARFLGNEMGCVFLQVGPAMLECQVTSWQPTCVTFVVPNMGLGPITAGRLQIIRGDGDIIRDYPICLIRKPDLIVHQEPLPQAPATLHERVEVLPQH
jgi:hypothetical protein